WTFARGPESQNRSQPGGSFLVEAGRESTRACRRKELGRTGPNSGTTVAAPFRLVVDRGAGLRRSLLADGGNVRTAGNGQRRGARIAAGGLVFRRCTHVHFVFAAATAARCNRHWNHCCAVRF